jgi:hypothetical protein
VPKQATLTEAEVYAAAERLDIPVWCIRARLKLGWSAHDAAHKPPRRRQGFEARSKVWLHKRGLPHGEESR